jgi:pyridinium-3,5-bisthiocarboxylic acid mononucleotide nickel chelatase
MTSPQRIAYADCFSGVSGNMFLGALFHAGLDKKLLQSALEKIDIGPVSLVTETTTCSSIEAVSVAVQGDLGPELRRLSSILQLLDTSGLPQEVITKSSAVFKGLALAEAKVHGITAEEVHFHEIGAIDTIVDIVGTVTGLHHLGIKRLISSPVPLGRGLVRCAHGSLPLPAPAVCELLRGIPVYGVDIEQELVTPTGAALLGVLADGFGPMEPMIIEKTGYGAGSLILPDDRPDIFRLIVGQAQTVSEAQEVEIIETSLDDWNPEGFPHVCDLLLNRGALDVSLTPQQTKKGRPGFRLQVLCAPAHAQTLKTTILSETSAIGLRFRKEHRTTLAREAVSVKTEWGMVAAKKIHSPSGIRITPEYEDCRKIALLHKVPLQNVYEAVYRASEDQS